MTTDSSSTMDVLAEDECLQLLATQDVGRIAIVLGRQPFIVPVNYVLDGETIVFRTDPGTKLVGASLERVAFEVDHIDLERQTAWSVHVQGVGQEVTSAYSKLFERMRSLAVHPWAPGEKLHWVRIMPRELTGRRLTAAQVST